MLTNRVARVRAVEYKISFVQRRREVYVYIGSIWAGRIIHSEFDHIQRGEGYGVYLQLPGMWGPVAREADLSDAKIAASQAIQRWLQNFSGTPTDPEERPEPVSKPTQRVTRTRAAEPAPAVARIRRTR